MTTTKRLALQAVERSYKQLQRVLEGFPPERWEDRPTGVSHNLRWVLTHLLELPPWWYQNIGVPEADRPAGLDAKSCASADELVELLGRLHADRMDVLRAVEDERFEEPGPNEYGFDSLAELVHYIAEHDYWHVGEIQVLKSAFTGESVD